MNGLLREIELLAKAVDELASVIEEANHLFTVVEIMRIWHEIERIYPFPAPTIPIDDTANTDITWDTNLDNKTAAHGSSTRWYVGWDANPDSWYTIELSDEEVTGNMRDIQIRAILESEQ